MPVGAPPAVVLNEFLGATTRHTRRVEIYESDGITRWARDTIPRLKSGSVSVDYDRDERRSLDLTLSNDDQVLVNAPGEFWYDKIIKVFRGVRVNAPARIPRILVVSDATVAVEEQAPSFRAAMMELGYGDVQVNTLASSYAPDLQPFDIIVSLGNQNNGALLKSAYDAGKSVFVFRGSATYFFDAIQGGTGWAGTSAGIPGTNVEVRRNLVKNPRVASTTSWFGNAGTGGTVTTARVATGGPDGGAFFRSTYTVANTTAPGAASLAGVVMDGRAAAALPMPCTAGQSYMAAIFARTSIAQRVAAALRWYNAAGTLLGTSTGAEIVFEANTWTQLVVGPVVAPVGATNYRVEAVQVAGTGAVPFPIGATFEATMAQSEVNVTELDGFFDGASSSYSGDVVYGWTGTANASESTMSIFTPNDSLSPLPRNDPRTVGWLPFVPVTSPAAYKAPATSVPGIFGIAYHPGGETNYAITSGENVNGGKFVAVHYPLTQYQYADASFRTFLRSVTGWLNPVVPLTEWEVQIGEFMIDRISEPHFPYEMKITGRDYTKKCMLSKFAESTSFAAGNSLESVITAIAVGAGISKRMLPSTDIIVGRDFFFERGKTRWEAMKEVCTAYKYEIYFDATGYLVIRPFRDPSTTTPIMYLETHNDRAQVASYEKSTSDTQIFNHIVISGENSDSATLPVWAEAKNINPYSPTNIENLGARYWEYVSEFIETEEQAEALAEAYLAIKSLEEFELSFESLMLPWLEVGDILGFIDPRRAQDDPVTFLLSSLSLPLDLGPMGGSARRITMIADFVVPGLTETTTWNELPAGITWNQLPSNMTWDDI